MMQAKLSRLAWCAPHLFCMALEELSNLRWHLLIARRAGYLPYTTCGSLQAFGSFRANGARDSPCGKNLSDMPTASRQTSLIDFIYPRSRMNCRTDQPTLIFCTQLFCHILIPPTSTTRVKASKNLSIVSFT